MKKDLDNTINTLEEDISELERKLSNYTSEKINVRKEEYEVKQEYKETKKVLNKNRNIRNLHFVKSTINIITPIIITCGIVVGTLYAMGIPSHSFDKYQRISSYNITEIDSNYNSKTTNSYYYDPDKDDNIYIKTSWHYDEEKNCYYRDIYEKTGKIFKDTEAKEIINFDEEKIIKEIDNDFSKHVREVKEKLNEDEKEAPAFIKIKKGNVDEDNYTEVLNKDYNNNKNSTIAIAVLTAPVGAFAYFFISDKKIIKRNIKRIKSQNKKIDENKTKIKQLKRRRKELKKK